MAEAWRKDEPLTTADLAGTGTKSGAETPAEMRETADAGADGGPRLVRNEQRDTSTAAVSSSRDEAVSPGGRNAGKDSVREMAGSSTPLLSETELSDLRSRWSDIQAGFVDEPRRSVEQADQLVASAIQKTIRPYWF